MIEKVLREFENREESVSINLSIHDVNSAEFREWFFAILQTLPDPKRIAVEVVESEDCANFSDMSIFAERLHGIGCKAAIDNFGTGYSSPAEITALEPDYIKVDGSIIAQLDSVPKNVILLKRIIFLAKQLRIETVAEFVETEAVQKLLEENEVDFFRGSFFKAKASLKTASNTPSLAAGYLTYVWKLFPTDKAYKRLGFH